MCVTSRNEKILASLLTAVTEREFRKPSKHENGERWEGKEERRAAMCSYVLQQLQQPRKELFYVTSGSRWRGRVGSYMYGLRPQAFFWQLILKIQDWFLV
jgi:hypothetical protein